MSTIMKSSSFELGTNGAGIDVTSHDDSVTFYVPLTAEQRRALADALVPGRDFSGVDWKVMYDRACRERDKWEEKYLDTDESLHKACASLHEACKLAQSYKVDAYQATERAEAAERQCDEALDRADQLRDERDGAVQSCITVGRARDEWRARAEAAEARTAPDVPLHQPDGTHMDASHLPIDEGRHVDQ